MAGYRKGPILIAGYSTGIGLILVIISHLIDCILPLIKP